MSKILLLEWKNSSNGRGAPSGDGWIGPDTETNLKNKISGDGGNENDYELYHDETVTGVPPKAYYARNTTTQTTQPTPSSGTKLSDDPVFKKINTNQQNIIKRVWKVQEDLFVKKDNTRFYKAGDSSDKNIYMGSWGDKDKIGLVKDIGVGKELHNKSYYTIDELNSASESDLKEDLIDVQAIKNETKKTMKNILKEEFQKRENDKNIISKRFNILSESKKTWTASNLISEVNYLKKQNYSFVLIKEGLVELMKSLYDDDPTFIPKIKDSYKGWLMKRLPNESDLFKKSLETSIEDLENDSVPALFTDCNKVVEMMYDAMVKGMVDEKFDVVGVPKDIEDLLRSEIIDNIKKDEFKSKVKQQLTNKICPQYGDLLKNTQKTFDDIKNKLVS
jgi:hypothetical protein